MVFHLFFALIVTIRWRLFLTLCWCINSKYMGGTRWPMCPIEIVFKLKNEFAMTHLHNDLRTCPDSYKYSNNMMN
jgi:hypothetical protein